MVFTYENAIFGVNQTESGLFYAKKPSGNRSLERPTLSLGDHEVLPNGENVLYPHLREWLVPILNQTNMSLSSIRCEADALPKLIQEYSSIALLLLVVNTFPALGREWIFTTLGLFESGQAQSYARDEITHPNNDWICTPTAYRRQKLTSANLHTAWVNFVTPEQPSQPPKIEFTSHVMALVPIDNKHYFLGDQYGTCVVDDSVIVKMAKARNSFYSHLNGPHLLQIVN